MHFTPYECQRKAMNFMMLNPRCALFLSLGFGKSIITLSVIQRLQGRGYIGPVLIVAPLRVVYSVWRQEAQKWDHTRGMTFAVLHGPDKDKALEQKADIYLINYEGIKWLFERLKKQSYRKRNWMSPFNMLVADESSALKAHNTQRFRLFKKLLPLFERRVLLTGTPAPNSLMNLWSQFYILDEGERLERYFTHFRNRYFQKADYHGYTYNLREGADAKIHQRIQDITLRLSAEDFIDMPDILYNKVSIKLPESVIKDIYKPLENDFFLNFNEECVTVANAAVLSLKLRQVIQGGLYTEDSFLSIHQEKISVLSELIDSLQNEGESVLIAYHFKFELDYLRNTFGDDTPVICGSTSARDAENIIDNWNKGRISALFAHPASLSHGVNLQAGGSTIIWLAPTWSLEQYSQFNARLYRQGQEKPVVVHHIIAENTIDEAVMEALSRKEQGQSALLNALDKYRSRLTN